MTPDEPATRWLVLNCKSSDTMRLSRRLKRYGAWTPIWKRKRRLPRSSEQKVIEQPAMPSFVFVPESQIHNLPRLPGTGLYAPWEKDKSDQASRSEPGIGFRIMTLDGVWIRVSNAALAPLRKIDTQPQDPIKVLPAIGAKVKFTSGPFEGLTGKLVYCTKRMASVKVEKFDNPVKVPPSIVQETGL